MKPEKQEDKMTTELVKSKAPSELIGLAIEKGNVDLDKVAQLLKLQREHEENEAKKSYNLAMAKFKASPPKIGKDKKVGYKTNAGQVGYSHASLYNVTEKINTELSKHELSASWTTKQNGNIIVTCKITHSQGHSEETSLSAPADTTGSKNAIQAIGSTITYLERYTLLALTGLATCDQDDDAKTAVPADCITEAQEHQLLTMISDKNADIKKFCAYFKIKEVAQLPKDRFQNAIVALEAKKTK